MRWFAKLTAVASVLIATAERVAGTDAPLFTGDGVRSIVDSPSAALNDGSLQLILTQALHQEQADAMYVLAMLKFYGQKVDADVAGAVRLLKKLANRQHRDAEFTLGALYASGAGELPQDDSQSAAWLASSASRGHAEAKWMLATLYNEGRGVKEDAQRALELLTDAATQDANPRAMFQLGVMHEYGRGVDQDLRKAAQLYQQASDLHVVDATFYLALLYASGRGVRKNSALALRLLNKAADREHPSAMLRLGELHADGVGVVVDYAQALHFFKRAAATESQVAAQARQRVEELQWVLSQAEQLVRQHERELRIPLHVHVSTVEAA